jgi:hypothetical protein
MLAGALHVRKPLRIAALFVYLAVAGEFADSARTVGTSDAWQRTLILYSLLAVPVFFAIRWRGRPRPFFEFCVLFVLVTATLTLCQAQIVHAEREFGGVSLSFTELASIVGSIAILALPFLFFIGIDIAEFGFRASEWTVEIARSKIARWAPAVLLAVMALTRVGTIVAQARTRFDTHNAGTVFLAYAGAFGVIAIAGFAWWVVSRLQPQSMDAEELPEEGRRLGIPLVLLFLGPLVLSQLLVLLTRTAITANLPLVTNRTTLTTLDLANYVNDHATDYRAIAGVICLGIAGWLARRGRAAAALFVAAVGGVAVWTFASSDGQWFDAFGQWTIEHQYIDGVVTLALVVLTVVWAVRRQLTPTRISGLAFLFVLTWLLGHLDFLSDPFSVQFAAAASVVLVFGIIFDTLTVGSWANVDSHALPRTSRLLVYLGYVVFTLVLVNFAQATHDLAQQNLFTGLGAQLGFQLLGRPMLLAVVAVVVAGLARGRDPLAREIEHVPLFVDTEPPEPGMVPF